MEYLFHVLEEIIESIDKSDRIFLFLDYDGTLTPIVQRPELAILPRETRELLRNISLLPKYTMCIVSGRPLDYIKNLIGIENIYYVGNHGLEAEGLDMTYIHPIAIKRRPIINELNQKITKALENISGALVEYKCLSLAVHYRMVCDNEVSKVKRIFAKITRPYVEQNYIKLTENKKTLEVLPKVDWGKGSIVMKILDMHCYDISAKIKTILPIYMGDAATDEDAFKVLKDGGISIFVSENPKKSNAKYYLNNTKEVIDFLKLLLDTPRRYKNG